MIRFAISAACCPPVGIKTASKGCMFSSGPPSWRASNWVKSFKIGDMFAVRGGMSARAEVCRPYRAAAWL